ncbi:MAG TPA: potassium transporter TrkH [Rhodobacteraceae bacterium]|nr:potassium transporter TrkH [Paracoccaceae bacterium]|tara:strand:- start:1002 stop:2450 length:1449 start_codon:yes stop_codon:yes gene_type:complete
MFDVRPVFNVVGLAVSCLGLTMLFPFVLDLSRGNGHWGVFLESSLITVLAGGMMFLATRREEARGLTLQQTFLLTTGVWVALPIFGALPFVLGATNASYTDAFFEAMSGLTTTGATVFNGLDYLPDGLLLWRSILQWLGGIGIIVVAMVFLPELRVGGMQIFRSEGFDTFGKILPRATEIASQIAWLYVALTAACAVAYIASGMRSFDAVLHAMTTIATGGFSSYDASFVRFGAATEYSGALFMCLAGLPFVRYVQLINGQPGSLFKDSQVRMFFAILTFAVVFLTLVLWQDNEFSGELSFRKALFNVVSIVTGTGYASANYNSWGPVAVVLFFYAGLVGGCAGSTSCSVKVFRYQLLVSAIHMQLRKINSPHGVFNLRYQGRIVGMDVINSVISFFVIFFVSMVVSAMALAFTGLDMLTAFSGAAAALANIGPGLGDVIGPSGNYSSLSDTAKWILAITMLLGRLELLAVYTLFTLRFWRN